MKHFHLHIYFGSEVIENARALFERAQLAGLFEVVKFRQDPVGPHPTGMIEAHFNEASFQTVVQWTESHRGDFPALIHHDSGDDFKDHTEGSLWLGKKMPLDFSFFELIQKRPEFRINPE